MPKFVLMNDADSNVNMDILTSVAQEALGDMFSRATRTAGAAEISFRGLTDDAEEVLWDAGLKLSEQRFRNEETARGAKFKLTATPRKGFDFGRK